MTAKANGENVAGDRKPEIAALPLSISYDAANDILTVDGFKFAGELMRMFTITPCGTMFRIIERKDGTVTISTERDPLAAAAPDLLAAAKKLEQAEEFNASVCTECEGDGVPEECGQCFPFFDDARVMRRNAIAKAEGR
jgi:hypothetical protein